MATRLSRSAWAKFSVFRKNGPFLLQNEYIYRIFLLEFEISASQLTPVPNFSFIGQKIRELEFWPGTIPKTARWRHTYLLVMKSSNCLWLLIDVVTEYRHAKFGCNWTTNKGEIEGGIMCPPQPVWFQKTPAWIRLNWHAAKKFKKKPGHRTLAIRKHVDLSSINFHTTVLIETIIFG